MPHKVRHLFFSGVDSSRRGLLDRGVLLNAERDVLCDLRVTPVDPESSRTSTIQATKEKAPSKDPRAKPRLSLHDLNPLDHA